MLTDWPGYPAPFAGRLVALRPRYDVVVMAAGLAEMIVNLLVLGGYSAVALRDLGMFAGAFALWRLINRPADPAGLHR